MHSIKQGHDCTVWLMWPVCAPGRHVLQKCGVEVLFSTIGPDGWQPLHSMAQVWKTWVAGVAGVAVEAWQTMHININKYI